MQDEINEKVVALSVKGAKLTAEMLQKAIKAMLAQAKKQQEKQPHGKQTLKQLAKQNAGLSNIEITEGNIKAFEQTAKKYGIDFALKKDSTETPPRYLVFFKGRDADALTAAFKEFSAKKLNKEQKPSIRKALATFREAAKQLNANRQKTKHKDREVSLRSLKGWLSDLKEKKAVLLEALEQAKEPTLPEPLFRYLEQRSGERADWTSRGKLKGTVACRVFRTQKQRGKGLIPLPLKSRFYCVTFQKLHL